LDAANAIQEHYQEIQELAGSIDIYAESILKAATEVSDNPRLASGWADFLLSDLEDHQRKKQRLVELIIAGHTLGPYWSIVTLRKLGLPATLQKMATIASEFMPIFYFAPLPDQATTSVMPPERIVFDWFNEKRAQDFCTKYSSISTRLVWPTTLANAVLHSKITPDTLTVWLNGAIDQVRHAWSRLVTRDPKPK
jgi:hypothetical protein